MVLRWLFPPSRICGDAELDPECGVCGSAVATERSQGVAGTREGGDPSLISCSCPPPAPGWSKALAVDGARKTGAEEAQSPKGKGERERPRQEEEEEEEEMAGAPRGPLRGGKSREQQEERLSKEWEDAKRWSKMDQLAKELTAEKRLEGEQEDDPDHSMKQPFQARGYGFRSPGLQLHRGWRPSSPGDTVEPGLPLQVHSYPEEKKEEEGSANRRPEVGMGGSRPWARPLGRGPH